MKKLCLLECVDGVFNMINFYIQLRNTSTKERTFKLVKGYKLPYGLGAYRDDADKWCLTDIASGGSVVTGLTKYADLTPYLKDKDFLDKISKRRETETYQKLKKSLEDYLGTLPKEEDLKPEDLW